MNRLLAILCTWFGLGMGQATASPIDLSVENPFPSDGLSAALEWAMTAEVHQETTEVVVLRSEHASGPWQLIKSLSPGDAVSDADPAAEDASASPMRMSFEDLLVPDPVTGEVAAVYYRIVALTADTAIPEIPERPELLAFSDLMTVLQDGTVAYGAKLDERLTKLVEIPSLAERIGQYRENHAVFFDEEELPEVDALELEALRQLVSDTEADLAFLESLGRVQISLQGILRNGLGQGRASFAEGLHPKGTWWNFSLAYRTLLAIILLTGGLMLWFTRQAQRGAEMFIRRIPGIDAIEEGIGRATEMGKPVLYVPGIDDLQDIQTIASMLILGQVSKTIAEYKTDLIVTCAVPIVREVADEVVRAGYYQAGFPDAYRPDNIRFISSDQFAFCAGTNGIIHRQKPATNIYLGRFFAESLILAETGYVNRSIQIAGTAEATQLPFFVAACDYTLIGEELFAVSAYLSRDPRLVSSLKASDYVKVALVAVLLIGTVSASLGHPFLIELFTIAK